jgi:hypothetical protein
MFPSLTPAEAQREAELHHTLRNIALAQREAKAEPLRRALALKYSVVQEQLQATLETIRENNPEYVTLRRATPISYEDIQRYLADTPWPI